ncbi:DEHA2D06061p protein, partial [Puccinia sorghi]
PHRPFGCLTYSLIPKERRNFKLNPTAERGIMLGYENNFSSYCIFKLEERNVVRVCDIKFDKFTFPGTTEEEEISKIFDAPSCDHQVEKGGPEEIPKAPRDILSQISTDNILSVNRRGNSVIMPLTQQTHPFGRKLLKKRSQKYMITNSG